MEYYVDLGTITERVLNAAKPLQRLRHPAFFVHFTTEW